MTPTLILNSNNAQNPLSLDLSQYLDLTDGTDINPQDPTFTTRVISHSLLKVGGVLALSDYQAKELVFPLRLNADDNVALQTIIAQINQIVESPGATYSWTPPGASQATIFDAISGQFDVKYRYREDEAKWCSGDLRLFCQPFGHTGAPRPYAAASGVGPLLIISPYASGGGQIISASTQAGVAGYGGASQGGTPSGGIFYWGSPSLAGDAPAKLQISYVGPSQLVNGQTIPNIIAAVLPDENYAPLITARNFNGGTLVLDAHAVASTYVTQPPTSTPSHFPVGGGPQTGFAIPATYEGQHRLLAIARASSTIASTSITATISVLPDGNLVTGSTVASIQPQTDWGLYDLGTFGLRASQPPGTDLIIQMGGASATVDLSALIALPDANAWFLAGPQASSAYQTNVALIDDVAEDQFLYFESNEKFAPSPSNMIISSIRVTQYSRGLVPQPQPGNGLPIIALVGVYPPMAIASNPQNGRTLAQVNVLERTRYVLP